MFSLTEYQKQFREKLSGDDQQNFDQVVALAQTAKTPADIVSALPDGFKELVKNAQTIEAVVSKVFEVSSWGPEGQPIEYKEPKSTLAPKTKSTKPVAVPTKATAEAPAPVEGEKKRKGNPEALAKARIARGNSPGLGEADKTAIANDIVALLTENKGVLVHVKDICAKVSERLKGKLTVADSPTDAKVYEVLQAQLKTGKTVYVGEVMEGRKKGYKIPA